MLPRLQPKKASSSSSEDDGKLGALQEEVASLKEQNAEQEDKISTLKNKLAEAQKEATKASSEAEAAGEAQRQLAQQTARVASLEQDITHIKTQNAQANESLQAEVAKLHEKIKALENNQQQNAVISPRPNGSGSGWGKVNTPALQPSGSNNNSGAASSGDLPEWKRRQQEREKEEEEKRNAEAKAKLTKVSSIKIKGGEISRPDHGAERPHFKDPLLSKQETPSVSAHNPADEVLSPSSLLGGGKTVEELEAEEEARIMKNFARGKK